MITKPVLEASKDDAGLISQIATRAVKKLDTNRLATEVDITLAHLNGTPLELQKLLDSSPFDFAHDVCGIMSSIDRTTGKLGIFEPRCARREVAFEPSDFPTGQAEAPAGEAAATESTAASGDEAQAAGGNRRHRAGGARTVGE